MNGDPVSVALEVIDVLEGKPPSSEASVPEEERVASEAAADFCVPKAKLDSFMTRKHPFYYERDVLAFAHLHERHPGLVVGQMQHRLDRYDYLTRHQVKVRSSFVPSAITDGWGQIAPVAL